MDPPSRPGFCVDQKNFNQWFDNKVFYMWSSGNYLDPRGQIQSDDAMKQRMVYQLDLNTKFGFQSHVYYELNMSEVKVKHEGDHAFGYEKPEP